jgi:hypothetical protein
VQPRVRQRGLIPLCATSSAPRHGTTRDACHAGSVAPRTNSTNANRPRGAAAACLHAMPAALDARGRRTDACTMQAHEVTKCPARVAEGMLLAGSTDIGQTRVVGFTFTQLPDVQVPPCRNLHLIFWQLQGIHGQGDCRGSRPWRALRMQARRAARGAATHKKRTGAVAPRDGASLVNLAMTTSWAASRSGALEKFPTLPIPNFIQPQCCEVRADVRRLGYMRSWLWMS